MIRTQVQFELTDAVSQGDTLTVSFSVLNYRAGAPITFAKARG